MRRKRTFAAAAILLFSMGGGWASAEGPPIKVKVTAEIANIRLKPSIGSVIIRQIPQGDILEATRKEGEWFEVKLDPDESGTTSGYVHESLVLPLEDVPPPLKPVIIDKPAEKPSEKPIEKPAEKPAEKPNVETIPAGISEETVEDKGRISVWLYGGPAYGLIGDLNRGAQGLADLFSAQLGLAADRDVDSVRSGFLFGGEIGIPLSPGVYLSLGADILSAGKESLINYARPGGAAPDSYTAYPKFTALPVRVAISLYPLEFLYIKIGAAYYFASCDYFARFEHDKFRQEWTGEAKGSGFGVLGGIGLDWRLATGFSFVAEMTGQYAPISGFEGTGTFQDSSLAAPVTEEGILYAYDAKPYGQTKYPMLFIRNKMPAEAGVENAREAKIDFSGLSLRVGLKIRF